MRSFSKACFVKCCVKIRYSLINDGSVGNHQLEPFDPIAAEAISIIAVRTVTR